MAPMLAIISSFLYAVSMVMVRIGLRNMDAFSAALISMGSTFIGSLFLFYYYIPVSHLASWALFYFVVAGLSGPCIGKLLLFAGINRVGSSIASTLYSIKPLFSALGAVLILSENLTIGIGIATVIMVAGLAIIGSKESGKPIQGSWSKKDLLFPILAGAAYGTAQVFRKIGLNIRPDPMMGVVVQNAAALSFSIVFAFLKRNQQPVKWNKKRGWILFGLSGIIILIGQMLLFHALNMGNVLIVSPLSAISPLFVIFLASIFLRKMERVTWKITVGAILIVSGTVLLSIFPG